MQTLFGRFVAMKLQQIGTHRTHDILQLAIVGIDGERHHRHKRRHGRAEPGGL